MRKIMFYLCLSIVSFSWSQENDIYLTYTFSTRKDPINITVEINGGFSYRKNYNTSSYDAFKDDVIIGDKTSSSQITYTAFFAGSNGSANGSDYSNPIVVNLNSSRGFSLFFDDSSGFNAASFYGGIQLSEKMAITIPSINSVCYKEKIEIKVESEHPEYKWFMNDGTGEVQVPNVGNTNKINVSLIDLYPDKYESIIKEKKAITFRVYNPINKYYSAPKRYNWLDCPPDFVDLKATNAKCVNGDGEANITVDSDLPDGYHLRIYLYKESANIGYNPETEEPPSSSVNQISLSELAPLNDGSGNFQGKLSNIPGDNDEGYKIVYQTYKDAGDGENATVTGGVVTEVFYVREPSPILIDPNSVTTTQPKCASDKGQITFSASGGGYDNTNATLQYGLLKSGETTIKWEDTGSFSGLDEGIYTIHARHKTNTECKVKYASRILITSPTAIQFSNPKAGLASTATAKDGQISIEFTGGTPNYSYVLTKNNTTVTNAVPIITNNGKKITYERLGIGNYTIKVVDQNDCELTSGIIKVTTAPKPSLGTPTYTAVSCATASDGAFSIPVSFGNNNDEATTIRYKLINDQNTEVKTGNIAIDSDPNTSHQISIVNIPSGNYTLAVISTDYGDFNNADTVVTKTITIDEVAPIEIDFTTSTITNTSCNGAADGSIVLNVSGNNYQYALTRLPAAGDWKDLPANKTITGLAANSYSIILRKKDNPSCQSQVYNSAFVVAEPTVLTVSEITANHQDVTSNGGNNGAIAIEVSGGTPSDSPNLPYTFQWSGTLDRDGSTYSNTTQNINNLFSGTYQVVVTDANSCTATLSQAIRITEPGPLSIESLTGSDTCSGLNSGTLTATIQGTGNIKFDFLLQGPTERVVYTTTTTERTVNATNLAAGTYGLRITEVANNNTVTTPVNDYYTINELTPITATVTPTNLNCNEANSGSITITGTSGGSNSGFEYALDDGFGFQSGNTFTGLAPRTYVVTIRDNLGCEYSTSVEVVQSGAPKIDEQSTQVNNASSDTSLDGAIILEFETDATDYSYSWTGPGVTGRTTKNLDLLGAGTYQVIVTAPGNCTLTRSFTVGVQAPFSIQSFSGTPSCFNQSNGSLTATIIATGPVTFNWTLADGTIVTTETTNLRTLSTQGLPPGNYYLEIVAADNKKAQSDLFEIMELAEVTAVVMPVPTCSGTNKGIIRFSNPVGSPSNTYSYSIDDGATFQTSPVFENLALGSYTARMRTAESDLCDFVLPGITITNSPALFWDEPNTQITRASGPGAQNGAIAPAFTGGTAPLSFQWSANANNATTQNIAGLAAGIYTLTITDAASCSITNSFEVTEVGPLTISNITTTNAICKDEANGSITTTVTGEGTITYQWKLANGNPVPVSNGVNTANLTGILAGDYVLTVTDDNTTVSSAAITISEPATAVTITAITPTNASCFGANDGSLRIEAAGGSGPYTYSVNGGAFQPSPITNLIANSYSLSVRDANGCEYTQPAPVLITEPAALNLIINEQRPTTAANATDGAIFITAEGGSGNYTYQWTGPNGFSATEEDILNLGAGDYTVTITDANFGISNDNGCRLVSTPITIVEPGVLIATINQSVLLECSGDDFAEITANVQGGVTPYTYEWFQVTNGNNTALSEDTDIIANLSAGSYFLKVTDANLISVSTRTITITAPAPLEITVDNITNIICKGQPTGAATITVSGGTLPYQYFWSNAATVPSISGLNAGEYTLEVEDGNGCIAQTKVTITEPNDAVQITDAAITNASAYQAVDGRISLAISGGATPYSYQWTQVSTNAIVGNQATITNLAADSYMVTVFDVNGCTVTETYTVTQPDILEETIIQPTCTGDSNGSISILVNKGNGTFTYAWNTGATDNSINNLAAGSYTVTVSGFETGPVTRTYLLENPPPLEVNLGLDRVLCVDQVLALDATVDDETATYSWTADNGFTSSEPKVELSQTGNYTVTVESQTGCTAQGSIFVDVSTEEIDAQFAVSSQVFTGETIIAVDISYPLPDGIEWILPVGAEIKTQDEDAVEFSFAEAGEYEITAITTRGECIAQKTKKIIVVAKNGLITEEDSKNGQKLVEEFVVFPNPTSGKFTANINLTERGEVSVKVFSFANNSMITSKKERGNTTYNIPFDISGMPSGVYAVLLETPFGSSLRKIVIK